MKRSIETRFSLWKTQFCKEKSININHPEDIFLGADIYNKPRTYNDFKKNIVIYNYVKLNYHLKFNDKLKILYITFYHPFKTPMRAVFEIIR